MTHIAVIGAGFAGLTAIRTLRKLDKTIDITSFHLGYRITLPA